MEARGLLLVALCVALAGCGGSSDANRPARSGGSPQANHQCDGTKLAAKQEQQRRKLTADLRRLRVAAATVKHLTQKGNAAINRAVDRFELDVAEESIPVRSARDSSTEPLRSCRAHCYLCFQALEANRPLAAGAKLACG